MTLQTSVAVLWGILCLNVALVICLALLKAVTIYDKVCKDKKEKDLAESKRIEKAAKKELKKQRKSSKTSSKSNSKSSNKRKKSSSSSKKATPKPAVASSNAAANSSSNSQRSSLLALQVQQGPIPPTDAFPQSSKLSAEPLHPPPPPAPKKVSRSNEGGTPTMIKLHPQDPMLSVSSSRPSAENPTVTVTKVSQIEKEMELMKKLEAGKVKTLPVGFEGGVDPIARKAADVSSPPPLMAAPKPNQDSLMLPVSNSLTPVFQPPGSLEPLPTTPKPPSSKENASGYAQKV